MYTYNLVAHTCSYLYILEFQKPLTPKSIKSLSQMCNSKHDKCVIAEEYIC